METIPKLFLWYYQLKRGGNIFCETVSLIGGLSGYLFNQKTQCCRVEVFLAVL